MPGTVLTYPSGWTDFARTHEGMTYATLARILATLRGARFEGEHTAGRTYAAPLYMVPRDSLYPEEAEELGVHTVDDLYGGVVPRTFVRTKVISHGLVDESSERPPGWSQDFERAVRDAVLPGYTAFTHPDALRAGERLLEMGAVRLKDPAASGGHGQRVVRSRDALTEALAALPPADVERRGLVLEQNLEGVCTLSVGLVTFAGDTLAYLGTQRLTQDNTGGAVYGGTDLLAVRGGWEGLSRLHVPASTRRALAQARAYDEGAVRHYGLVASRRNYDVATGRDALGRRLSGVLEASWRIGGASGAEVAALQAFHEHPSRHALRVACAEVYGEDASIPEGAQVLFHGTDAVVGPLVKYTLIHEHGGP